LDELSSRYSSPKVAIYGEVVGVQDLKYGLSSGEVDFYAFDIRVEDCPYVEQYLPPLEVEEVCKFLDLKVAPTLYVGPFTTEVLELKEGLDPIGKTHVREGIVIKPLVPRWHSKLHRVCLKKIGNGYLFRSGQKDE
jgi:ATP-dependent RNA circularization protein (DNA/RNA ligase family)